MANMNKLGWIVAVVIAALWGYTAFVAKGKEDSSGHIGPVTVRDTVVVHDTLVTVKTVDQIKVVTRSIHDTFAVMQEEAIPSEAISTPTKDTKRCYSSGQDYADGAHVGAEVCSEVFPEKKPIDLTMTLSYVPSPDLGKIFERTDTLFVRKKPLIPTWQSATLGLVAGVLVGWLALK
jgi:hypothetical protein